MASVSWINIKCGNCQSVPQNVAIVWWIYIKCGHCQSGPQNVVIVSWIKEKLACHSARHNVTIINLVYIKVRPFSVRSTYILLNAATVCQVYENVATLKKVAIVKWIYIDCGFCQSVSENVAIVFWLYKKVAIVHQIHKMRLMSIGSIQNVAIVS